MLWDKGVAEFVAAARKLRASGVVARFWLVGAPDPDNPTSISKQQLQAWTAEGCVEWLGWRTDVPAVIGQSHIFCLPSYREGLPKSLLEAMAGGRAVVATDVPGCREAVEHGRTGLLVPPRDPDLLTLALKQLIDDPILRRSLGAAARSRAELEFSSERVIAETLALYKAVIADSRR
jgi:glycosyltransferase involved in cell wall biosynthesis